MATKQTKQQAAHPITTAPATPTAAPAMVQVKAGAVYKTKAPHNVGWWDIVQGKAATAPAPVADIIAAGVPSHFVGYCTRRGYLVSA